MTDPLDIHEPIVLNFVDGNEWITARFLRIPSTSNITVLPSEIFQKFPHLQALEVSSGLKSITKTDFEIADELTRLDMYGNELQMLPTNVFEFTKNLETIILSKNQLTTIEAYAFNGLTKLDALYLNNNSLTELKRNTFAGAPDILFIDLHGNRIESIEDDAFVLPKLGYLYLSNNRIHFLSDNMFRGAHKLLYIDFAENDLRHIGKAFHDLDQLVFVDLSHNRINDLDLIAFAKLPRLLSLGLNNSGFQWGNGDQWPYKPSTLKHLDIASNSLTGTDPLTRLRHFSNLETLNLEGNNFSELDGFKNIGKDFPKINEIGLTGNKFTCDKLKSIVDSLLTQMVTVRGTVDICRNVKKY